MSLLRSGVRQEPHINTKSLAQVAYVTGITTLSAKNGGVALMMHGRERATARNERYLRCTANAPPRAISKLAERITPGYLNPLPPRRFRQARIERGKRCPGVFRARQMPRVGCRELGREIARQAPSELKIGRARGEALAAGAQGVVVQKSAIYLLSGKPSDPQMARRHGAHLKTGKIADNDCGAQTGIPGAGARRMRIRDYERKEN